MNLHRMPHWKRLSEIYLKTLDHAPDEVAAMHEAYGLDLVGQILTEGASAEEHAQSLDEQFAYAAQCGARAHQPPRRAGHIHCRSCGLRRISPTGWWFTSRISAIRKRRSIWPPAGATISTRAPAMRKVRRCPIRAHRNGRVMWIGTSTCGNGLRMPVEHPARRCSPSRLR